MKTQFEEAIRVCSDLCVLDFKLFGTNGGSGKQDALFVSYSKRKCQREPKDGRPSFVPKSLKSKTHKSEQTRIAPPVYNKLSPMRLLEPSA
jgi:hypothetical protein